MSVRLKSESVSQNTKTSLLGQKNGLVADVEHDQKSSCSQYIKGYEEQISKIAAAVSDRFSEGFEGSDNNIEHQVLPENIKEEIQSLISASVKIGSVIKYFHEVANKTNLFALKFTSDALHSSQNFSTIASEVKTMAEETHSSAEKIYSCMYSIQQTIVEIIDRRFEDYKHISVDRKIFEYTEDSSVNGEEKVLGEIDQKILNSLIDELHKLRASHKVDQSYNELGNFADQLNQEINHLRAHLRAS